MVQLLGCKRLLNPHHVRQLHQPPLAAEVYFPDIVGGGAGRGLHLQNAIVLLRPTFEIRDDPSAEERLERQADIRDRNAESGGSFTIDGEVELGLVQPEVGVQVDHVSQLGCLAHDSPDGLVQFLVRLPL